MIGTREQFLKPAKRRYTTVALPVCGLTMRIRSLMEGEKERYEAATLTQTGGTKYDRIIDARRRLVILCVVDDDGNPLLQDGDLETLKELDGADMATLQEACAVHTGFKAGDIEGLAGNSAAARVDDSPSD